MKDRPYRLSNKDVERLQTVTFGQLHADYSVQEAVLTARLISLCNRYNQACEVYANGGFFSRWSEQAADMERSAEGRAILTENTNKAEAERDSLPIKMQKLIDKEDADEHGQNRDRFHVVKSGMHAYITFIGDRIPWQS
jgi:hypothetical protein